jgi:hypothetical protein
MTALDYAAVIGKYVDARDPDQTYGGAGLVVAVRDAPEISPDAVMFIFDYGFEFTTTAGKALHIEIYADEQTYHAFVRPFPKEHLT